jgi:hypothetical protein
MSDRNDDPSSLTDANPDLSTLLDDAGRVMASRVMVGAVRGSVGVMSPERFVPLEEAVRLLAKGLGGGGAGPGFRNAWLNCDI